MKIKFFTFILLMITSCCFAQTDTTRSGTLQIKKISEDSIRERFIGKWNYCDNNKYSKKFKCSSQPHSEYYEFFADGKYVIVYILGRKDNVGKWSYKDGSLTLKLDASQYFGSYEIIWTSNEGFAYKQKSTKKTSYMYFQKWKED